MWTAEQRARHKGARPKERRSYPTDISDKEWKLVEPLLPGVARTRLPQKTVLREVINALRYLVRSGCEWRMLPNDFPPHQTVYYPFRRLMLRFLFRTIHITVDTDGRLLAANLTSADITDSTGAQLVLDTSVKRWPWVKHRRTLLDKEAYLDFTVEIVCGLQGQGRSQVQPRQWVVERTFAWLMRYRRLARDDEQRLDVSQAMIYISLDSSLLHRIRCR